MTGYLDQVIDELDYRNQKVKLLSEKKSLEEEMTSLSHKQNDWLEPFQNWLKVAQNLDKIASDDNLFAKKVVVKEVFGSNLLLSDKIVRVNALNSLEKMGENQWTALRAAHQLASEKPLSSVLVALIGPYLELWMGILTVRQVLLLNLTLHLTPRVWMLSLGRWYGGWKRIRMCLLVSCSTRTARSLR